MVSGDIEYIKIEIFLEGILDFIGSIFIDFWNIYV